MSRNIEREPRGISQPEFLGEAGSIVFEYLYIAKYLNTVNLPSPLIQSKSLDSLRDYFKKLETGFKLITTANNRTETTYLQDLLEETTFHPTRPDLQHILAMSTDKPADAQPYTQAYKHFLTTIQQLRRATPDQLKKTSEKVSHLNLEEILFTYNPFQNDYPTEKWWTTLNKLKSAANSLSSLDSLRQQKSQDLLYFSQFAVVGSQTPLIS